MKITYQRDWIKGYIRLGGPADRSWKVTSHNTRVQVNSPRYGFLQPKTGQIFHFSRVGQTRYDLLAEQ